MSLNENLAKNELATETLENTITEVLTDCGHSPEEAEHILSILKLQINHSIGNFGLEHSEFQKPVFKKYYNILLQLLNPQTVTDEDSLLVRISNLFKLLEGGNLSSNMIFLIIENLKLREENQRLQRDYNKNINAVSEILSEDARFEEKLKKARNAQFEAEARLKENSENLEEILQMVSLIVQQREDEINPNALKKLGLSLNADPSNDLTKFVKAVGEHLNPDKVQRSVALAVQVVAYHPLLKDDILLRRTGILQKVLKKTHERIKDSKLITNVTSIIRGLNYLYINIGNIPSHIDRKTEKSYLTEFLFYLNFFLHDEEFKKINLKIIEEALSHLLSENIFCKQNEEEEQSKIDLYDLIRIQISIAAIDFDEIEATQIPERSLSSIVIAEVLLRVLQIGLGVSEKTNSLVVNSKELKPIDFSTLDLDKLYQEGAENFTQRAREILGILSSLYTREQLDRFSTRDLLAILIGADDPNSNFTLGATEDTEMEDELESISVEIILDELEKMAEERDKQVKK